MTQLDKPVSRSVTWEGAGERFTVTLEPGPGNQPYLTLKPFRSRISHTLPLSWIWLQMCLKSAGRASG